MDSQDSYETDNMEQTVALIQYDEEEELQLWELLCAEEFAYNELIEAGGIPSHKRTGREHIEPPDDGIFHFWVNDTDHWTVFGEQLAHWQRFIGFQKRWRPGLGMGGTARGIFPSYVFEVVSSLERAGVMYRNLVGEDFLQHDISKQSRAVTWLEYFYFVYKECEMAADTIRTEPWYWDKPWNELITSGVLTGRELNLVKDMVGAKVDRFEEMEGDVPEGDVPEDKYSYRMDMLTRFARGSDIGRQAMADFKRHNVLLEWILRQLYAICGKDFDDSPKFNPCVPILPHIKQESWSVAVAMPTVPSQLGTKKSPVVAKTFTKFLQLPPELRQKIWLETLPSEPMTHFFQVVNATHPVSRFHFWSPSRFGIKATSRYESGYKAIYPIVSSCYEARQFVWNYYRSEFCRSNGRALDREADLPDFSNFDWLPEGDLIALCFPPEKGEIPEKDAISLEVGISKPKRNVGIYMSEKIVHQQKYGGDGDVFHMGALDWDMRQVRRIPRLLQSLCRRRRDGKPPCKEAETGGGIGRLFVIAGGCEQNENSHDVSEGQGWWVGKGRSVRPQKKPGGSFSGLSHHTVLRFKNSIAGGLLDLSGLQWHVEVLEEWKQL